MFEASPPPFFSSLSELDQYYQQFSPLSIDGTLKYYPRPSPLTQGKLLVCHDYKVGSMRHPFQQRLELGLFRAAIKKTLGRFVIPSISGTFAILSSSGFSHHRVTIPPVGWINSAHRQGVKILGTLIFEGLDTSDIVRLLYGETSPETSELSDKYIKHLSSIASERGFDGYLLNFESHLPGGQKDTDVLIEWIARLKSQLVTDVGDHSEVIWYDSVTIRGKVAWQDQLCELNYPFFSASSSIFTNYTWPPHFPAQSARYLMERQTTDRESGEEVSDRSPGDIFCGIDMWGRGSYGGGGFGAYKAVTHINPRNSGLSVSIFGQAWSWETEEDKPDFTWEKWWDYDRRLWLGSQTTSTSLIQDSAYESLHTAPGNYPADSTPLSAYFAPLTPPKPEIFPFHTTFSPGIGRSWFIDGFNMTTKTTGWTDVDKQTSLGDLIWPTPIVNKDLLSLSKPDTIKSSVDLCFDDAWLGGSSLRLMLSSSQPPLVNENSSLFFPISSVTLSPSVVYSVIVVYKVVLGSSFTLHAGVAYNNSLTNSTPTSRALTNGWFETTLRLSVDFHNSTEAQVGIVLSSCRDEEHSLAGTVLIGQLTVAPHPYRNPRSISSLKWSSTVDNQLSWELDGSDSTGAQDDFLYYIVTAVPREPATEVYPRLSSAVYLGSTIGPARTFTIRAIDLSFPKETTMAFYVQGVTAFGPVALHECPWVVAPALSPYGKSDRRQDGDNDAIISV